MQLLKGGVGGNRTPDTKIFSLLLYRLSYRTIFIFGLLLYLPIVIGISYRTILLLLYAFRFQHKPHLLDRDAKV